MACFPTQSLLALLPRWFQFLLPFTNSDDGFWDDQEVPQEMRTGDTACGPTDIKPPSTGLHRADIERKSHCQSLEDTSGTLLSIEVHITLLSNPTIR